MGIFPNTSRLWSYINRRIIYYDTIYKNSNIENNIMLYLLRVRYVSFIPRVYPVIFFTKYVIVRDFKLLGVKYINLISTYYFII